jgi:hypothetical protein
MASSATIIITTAVAQARHDVQKHFEDADAYQAARAIAYDPPGDMHRREFERLVGCNILHEARSGLYWIDRNALRLQKERQARGAWMALAVIAIILLSAAGLVLLVAR